MPGTRWVLSGGDDDELGSGLELRAEGPSLQPVLSAHWADKQCEPVGNYDRDLGLPGLAPLNCCCFLWLLAGSLGFCRSGSFDSFFFWGYLLSVAISARLSLLPPCTVPSLCLLLELISRQPVSQLCSSLGHTRPLPPCQCWAPSVVPQVLLRQRVVGTLPRLSLTSSLLFSRSPGTLCPSTRPPLKAAAHPHSPLRQLSGNSQGRRNKNLQGTQYFSQGTSRPTAGQKKSLGSSTASTL